MSQILKKVRDVDPNNSEAVKEVLSSFIQNLTKHADADCNRWLRMLENVVTRFPKYCSTHRNAIETYLSRFLDRHNYYDVIEAAKCTHVLQQVRWPQDRTETSKSSWRDQMSLLCESAHLLIDNLFVDAVDIYKKSNQKIQSKSNSPLNKALAQITTAGSNKQTMLQIRLRNIFVFMQAMLVEKYPVAKPIQPQTILDVIVRSLSVTSGNKNQTTTVSDVKIQSLRTLDAMIACLGINLIPFSPLVFRMVMQTLRWSADNSNQGSREVRRSAYSSLGQWLTTLHVHRPSAAWEDELASHILTDTTPTKHVVELTMSTQPLKNLSKKAKRKLQNTMLKESTISNHMPGEKKKVPCKTEEKNKELALAALECAETVLTVCGVFLKPSTHKMFQDHFVQESYNINSHSNEYLLSLLRVLEACRKTTPCSVPPPTQYCLHLYSVLVNSNCKEISKFCSQALLDIRLHLHCSPPSINFTLEVQPEKEKIADKRKKISEKNRIALEALLGPEKLSENNGDIIVISDEPSSKKPRIEDDDKISLSSESVCSVEIDSQDDSENEEVVVYNHVTEKESNDGGEDENKLEKCQENILNMEETNKPEVIKETIDLDETEVENIIPVITSEEKDNTDKVDSVKETIYEATTQITLNISNDTTEEEDRPLSMEVVYDYPNTKSENVKIIEKMEDENLPSTNDTDDVQITCGQDLRNSQENEVEKTSKSKEDGGVHIEVKENGLDKTVVVENGNINEIETQLLPDSTAKNISSKIEKISVEDMLADFVDEVNEENREA